MLSALDTTIYSVAESTYAPGHNTSVQAAFEYFTSTYIIVTFPISYPKEKLSTHCFYINDLHKCIC